MATSGVVNLPGSSSGGGGPTTDVNIFDSAGNPLSSSGGALDVNVNQGFSQISPGYPTQIAVGTTSTQLLPANAARIYAHIANNSQFEIFVQYSSSAALNQGFRINPFGFCTISGGDLFKGVVNAIGVINTQLIDVLEGI